jgi:magnesium transporter
VKQRSFAISAGRFTEVPPDSLPKRLEVGDGTFWADVEDFTDEELTGWLESLGVSPEAAKAVEETGGRTQVRVFGQELLFGLPALASRVGSERVAVAFLCTKNFCATIHQKPVAALDRTVDALNRDSAPAEANTAQLVSTILAGLSGPLIEGIKDIRSRVLEMQDQMDRDPDGVDLGEILDYGSAIRGLDAITSELVVCFGKLKLLESTVLDLAANSTFQTVASDAQYLDRVGSRLEKRLSNLRDQYGMNQQDRTNQRLAVLTVISAIFLPITLLAGIYGMNFDVMPELHVSWAYPAVLVLMLTVAVSMLWYFRSRGWFK